MHVSNIFYQFIVIPVYVLILNLIFFYYYYFFFFGGGWVGWVVTRITTFNFMYLYCLAICIQKAIFNWDFMKKGMSTNIRLRE